MPRPVFGEGYVSSDACRSCHPGHFASWRQTFHRTMTQVASRSTILAPFERTELSHLGWTTVIEPDPTGDTLRVDMVDPQRTRQMAGRRGDPRAVPNPPRMRGPIVMTTGSHHLQTYWLRLSTGAYVQVPWVRLLAEERWIPVEASFLQPADGVAGSFNDWNSNCISCHSVGGRPGIDLATQKADTRAGELGISCEACHGPAQEHVRANRSPVRRYLHHLTEGGDDTIVQPQRLSSKASTQVCGQCHSVWVERSNRYLREGHPYRPGQDLHRQANVVRHSAAPKGWLARWLAEQGPPGFSPYFWADGTVRVAGREYNGLLESGCYQRGELSCLSCHSMHDAPPKDQVADGRAGDGACLQCHGDYAARIEEHTHHPVGSSGAACMNCHMPHTTWGLFEAMRSHRIDSPDVKVSVDTGRPNACNQCHLDKSLRWAAETMARWYGRSTPAGPQIDEDLPASVVWLLRGDAAQRAIAAWTLGWPDAQAVSGRGWRAPLLARLLDDDYAAVRQVAAVALRAQPGFAQFAYDFVGPPADRRGAVGRAVAHWRSQGQPADLPPSIAPLLPPAAASAWQAIDELYARRDRRPVTISE